MFRSRTSSCPKKNYASSAFCESDSASRAAAVLGAALISLFKLAAPPSKPEVSSTTRACLSQTGAGWYLTPLVFACGLGTHGDAAKRKRNENKPKKANLVFCTTDNTNSPPTDQSVDYSVLSPRTSEAPAIMDELRNGPRSGYKSRYKSSLPVGGWGTVRASICTSQAKVQIKVQIVPAGGRLGYSASICTSQATVQIKVQIVPAVGLLLHHHIKMY